MSSWGICGVIDDRFERLLALDHALANMTEAGADGALPCPAAPIVWVDYLRQKGGQIVSVKCGSRDVIRRSGESLEALEARAMAQATRGGMGHSGACD